MNKKLITSCITVAAIMLPMTGYSADSARTYVKDSAITVKIKSELAAEKASSLVKVGVDTTSAGVVVLTGSAENKAAIDRAVVIAKGVKGVTSVENNIQVKADDESRVMKTKVDESASAAKNTAAATATPIRTYVKDSAITIKIKAKLAAVKPSTLVKISVDTTDKGVVVLSGWAPTKAAMDNAVAIAKGVKGVTSVENEISIKADDAEHAGKTKVDNAAQSAKVNAENAAHSAKVQTEESAKSVKTYVKDSVITTKIKTELAAEKPSSLVKIGVDTTDKGVVVLTGHAASQAAIDRAVAIAKSVKGVTSVENSIQIRADK